LEKAGGKLQDVLERWSGRVTTVLTSSDRDFEYRTLCEGSVPKATRRVGRTSLVLALAMKISQDARLLMDEARAWGLRQQFVRHPFSRK
jgi:hypothetical protein